jgi:hypothetical protein
MAESPDEDRRGAAVENRVRTEADQRDRRDGQPGNEGGCTNHGSPDQREDGPTRCGQEQAVSILRHPTILTDRAFLRKVRERRLTPPRQTPRATLVSRLRLGERGSPQSQRGPISTGDRKALLVRRLRTGRLTVTPSCIYFASDVSAAEAAVNLRRPAASLTCPARQQPSAQGASLPSQPCDPAHRE